MCTVHTYYRDFLGLNAEEFKSLSVRGFIKAIVSGDITTSNFYFAEKKKASILLAFPRKNLNLIS